MSDDIPVDHPRRNSLLIREKLVKGWKNGLVAQVGLIAHGRGEAFDYLIGEKTPKTLKKALGYSAWLLINAKKPIISVNGNTAVLVREDLLELAKVLSDVRGDSVGIEINIFYRTHERMKKLIDFMEELNINKIPILGKREDARIPGLSSERAKCEKNGIFTADVVFVPLEDGDRCEALIKMDKKVIAVDLNPFSRTATTATVTLVDNITRTVRLLINHIKELNENKIQTQFNNKENLKNICLEIKKRIDYLEMVP